MNVNVFEPGLKKTPIQVGGGVKLVQNSVIVGMR